MKRDRNIISILNASISQERDLDIIENINIIKKFASWKNNVIKKWPFYNLTSIHNSQFL